MGPIGIFGLMGLMGQLGLILIPEEILALGLLLLRCLGREYGFQRIGVEARVPHFGSHRHGCRREILNLLQMESQLAGDVGQLGHILLTASWMAADEVRNDLLVEVLLATNAVELSLELIKLLERGFAHELQHTVAGVLGCYFQPATDMASDEFTGVLLSGTVGGLVLTSI